jgi:hypothetical protein
MAIPDPPVTEQYPNLASALCAFQANVPSVRKGNTAKVDSSKGSYSYDYADLSDVTDAALPRLAAVGLAWVTRPDTAEDGTMWMHYSLIHASTGEALEGSVAVGRKGDRWQDLGGALTYARRYMLVSVTGIAPGGDDNDGVNATAGREPVAVQAKQYLPLGLYDLSAVATRKQAESMFYTARGAGHLGLYVQTPNGDEVLFGDWLRATGSALPETAPEDEPAAQAQADETAEALAERLEAEAVAAHEATLTDGTENIAADDK